MKYKKILILVLLIAILVGLIIAYVKSDTNQTGNSNNSSNMSYNTSSNVSSKNSKQQTTLKSNSEIKSALVEQIEPHASYYLEEIYVEKNQFVEKGTNILKYTNGTYLTAPYDCIITDIQLPESGEKLLNSHYVEISSNKVLTVLMDIDEKQVNKVSVGTAVKISVPTLEKEYSGYVTKVASTASNGKFKVTIEFENDGNIKLGMTANVQITV